MDNISKEEFNKDLNAIIKKMISEPSNIEVAWVFFGDGTKFDENKAINDLVDTKYHDLINSIEAGISQCIESNLHNIDFSSYKSTSNDINQIILDFILNVRDNELYEIDNEKPELGVGFHGTLMVFLREMSLLAFNNSHYLVAMDLHSRCKELVSLIVEVDKTNRFMIEYEISKRNKTKANNRWLKHNQTRPEKKQQYLEIMDQENFTTFAETAEYIKQNIETDKK